MEIARISTDTLESFALIIKEDAFELLKNGASDTFAIGAVEDGMPVGVVVVRCTPPTGEIISLYVVEEYRRHKIGSMLCFEALSLLMEQEGFTMLVAPFTEPDGEDVFRGFFESMSYDLQKVGTDYTVRMEDVVEVMERKIKGAPKDTVKFYSELQNKEKNLLFKEGTDLSAYVREGTLREDLSIVAFDDEFKKILGCVLLAETDGDLALVWLRADESAVLLFKLFDYVIEKLKKEKISILHCPCINDRSDNLFQRTLGENISYDKIVSYEALFSFAG